MLYLLKPLQKLGKWAALAVLALVLVLVGDLTKGSELVRDTWRPFWSYNVRLPLSWLPGVKRDLLFSIGVHPFRWMLGREPLGSLDGGGWVRAYWLGPLSVSAGFFRSMTLGEVR